MGPGLCRGSNLHLDRVQPGRQTKRQREPLGPAGDPAPARDCGWVRRSSWPGGLPRLRSGLTARKAELPHPLLTAWQQALESGQGRAAPGREEIEDDSAPHPPLREAVAGRVARARACLELDHPHARGPELWELRFSLQDEARSELKLPAGGGLGRLCKQPALGEINVPAARANCTARRAWAEACRCSSRIGRRPRDCGQPALQNGSMAPAEPFVAGANEPPARLRDVGTWAWWLPPALSGGLAMPAWACRSKRKLPAKITGLKPRAKPLAVAACGPDDRRRPLTLKDPGAAGRASAAHWCSTRGWNRVRRADLRKRRKVLAALDPPLSASTTPAPDTATKAKPWQRLRGTAFNAGPRAAGRCWSKYHQQKARSLGRHRKAFCGQLRHVSGRAAWVLAFLHRFRPWRLPGPNDMGLARTIQLLAFLQHLQVEAGT